MCSEPILILHAGVYLREYNLIILDIPKTNLSSVFSMKEVRLIGRKFFGFKYPYLRGFWMQIILQNFLQAQDINPTTSKISKKTMSISTKRCSQSKGIWAQALEWWKRTYRSLLLLIHDYSSGSPPSRSSIGCSRALHKDCP